MVKPFEIPSGSMLPTLGINQRVLVDRVSLGEPGIGDIVVFNPPKGAERGRECEVQHPSDQVCPKATEAVSDTNFIKRIVAGPGDRLSIKDGHPVVNGVEAQEDFIRPCKGGGGCNFPEEIVIPPDHYFMMGDNRGASDDSRFWGPISGNQIIGQAFATYWPPNRIGVL